MAWGVAVETLVDAKETEEVHRGIGSGSTTVALLEQCVDIVGCA